MRLSLLLSLVVGGLPVVLTAQARQEPRPATTDEVHRLEGNVIRSVRVTGVKGVSEATILADLRTKAGTKLSVQSVRGDLAFLWNQYKLQARVIVATGSDGVTIRFEVKREFLRYDHTKFRGLSHFKVDQVRKLLDFAESERPTDLTAESIARRLEELYWKDGYANTKVLVRTDQKTSTLRFLVDEGPRAKVRSVEFRGNKSFPTSSFLGLRWNLLGSAGVVSKPGLLSDAAFSRLKLDADLDRLRSFYRGRGYKDAIVELYKLEFTPDYTGVHLGIRIFEGRLYRIQSVDIQQLRMDSSDKPRFDKKELLATIRLRPGDVATQDKILADQRRLALFYGRRGFPSTDVYRNLDRKTSFQVLDPSEVIDAERGLVRLTYVVQEGQRKRIRSIRISGNRFTRDEIIRRELSVFPGEFVNTEELERSRDRLFAKRYFGDPAAGDPGVTFRLRPIDVQPGELAPELVDLEVDVREGVTGQILWGVGLSSNTGPFANVQYNKRNFDWRRLPTSWNPIDWFSQILNNEAFHGGGQTLNLDLSPGTEISQASISFFEPDAFGTHLNTIGLGLSGYRTIRRLETYDVDTLGGNIRLEKRIGRDVSLGATFTNDRIKVNNIAADAPAVVWDAEGSNSVRSMGVNLSVRSLDTLVQPTSGFRVRAFTTYAPEWLAGDATFWKAGFTSNLYLALLRDSRDRAHVLEFKNAVHVGRAIGADDSLFLTERFFMGGQGTLRGFDFRRAGPTQFDRPTGGETRYLGTLEYSFPLFSSRLQGGLRETELIRGVGFLDAGMLGDRFQDRFFRQLRLSAGVGLRIRIPGLGNLPIALDFAWPLRRQDTDRLRAFSFSFRFN